MNNSPNKEKDQESVDPSQSEVYIKKTNSDNKSDIIAIYKISYNKIIELNYLYLSISQVTEIELDTSMYGIYASNKQEYNKLYIHILNNL